MEILTIIGARPQFIKAAMISRAFTQFNQTVSGDEQIQEQIIHTGQHYDENMSEVFFREMGIRQAAVNLNCGGRTHGAMTGRMLEAIEIEIKNRSPDWVLVYGDTNSTLAGALAAAKLGVPIAHVEAGLRSYNRKMPEEINRIATDHVSDLLLCPTTQAVRQLQTEGISQSVHHVGDVMYDAALFFAELSERDSEILKRQSLKPNRYVLATAHRAENTDDAHRLQAIFEAFREIATHERPLVLPLHPRTLARLKQHNLEHLLAECSALQVIPPVGFLDMVKLERHASLILTDSGGVQKEAYFHGVPCITLREETEWTETVDNGWNQIVGANKYGILQAVESASTGTTFSDYGSGDAAEKIVRLLASSHAAGS